MEAVGGPPVLGEDMKNGHKPTGESELLTEPAEATCGSCGMIVGSTAKFCPECGTPRATEAPATTMTEPPLDVTAVAVATERIGDGEAPAPVSTVTTVPLHSDQAPTEAAEDVVVPAADDVVVEKPRAVRWWHRRSVLVAVVTALVVGLGFGGLTLFNAMNRRPVVAALTASSVEFADAVAAMASAGDLAAVSETAEEMPGWLRAIEVQQQLLESTRSGGLQQAAQLVVAAQVEYLEALRPLADVEPDDLSDWPGLATSLADATASLDSAMAALTAADAAAVGDANTDASAATLSVETAVALATADKATLLVERSIQRMASAVQLADVRAAASRAEESNTELRAALETLEGLADAEATQERLSLQAAFLDGLAGLQALTAENLGAWDALQVSLTEQSDQMVAGLGLKAADRATLAAELREMRASVGLRVSTAQRRLAAWRRDVREAERQRDEELAALAAYESGYRTQMERYNDLRDNTADFTERIREDYGVTYDEAYSAFYDGISQREEVREAMNALSPPDSVRSNHLAVVGVIDDAIAAMQAAVDGLADSQFCYYCYYEDTPGWHRFQDESDRITDEFASVTSSWDAAVSSRRAELEDLKLPARPEV